MRFTRAVGSLHLTRGAAALHDASVLTRGAAALHDAQRPCTLPAAQPLYSRRRR